MIGDNPDPVCADCGADLPADGYCEQCRQADVDRVADADLDRLRDDGFRSPAEADAARWYGEGAGK
jgi:predicted amidophosphoribosyltransferase